MNILIPNSWLRELVKTKVSNEDIAQALGLSALGVERIIDVNGPARNASQTRLAMAGGEAVYEIEVPPNRSDALSVIGVTREVVAALPQFGSRAQLAVRKVEPPLSPQGRGRQGKVRPRTAPRLSLDVEITDSILCPHFAALVLDNVTVAPSSDRVQMYLEAAGLRGLNNIIDTTNFVMIETGQPLHAFDFDKLAGSGEKKKMILRASQKGEELTTLDGAKRDLPEDSIIIDDGEEIIDLCGIMGGKNTAISKSTRRVILFAQVYDPVRIRRASMALGHRTEAALRFEKGLDPEMVVPALYQAAEMVIEGAGAKIASELIEIRPEEFKPHTVTLTKEKLDKYLGIDLELKEAAKFLGALGLKVKGPTSLLSRAKGRTSNRLTCTVPSWRDKDILIEEDLIEEVARLYGYHNLPSTLPSGQPPAEPSSNQFRIERRLKYLLKDLGFTEVYANSMVPEAQWKGALEVRNPATEEMKYLRADLGRSLVGVVEKNKANFGEIKIFEMSNVYFPDPAEDLPDEKMFLSASVWKEEKVAAQIRFIETIGLVQTIFEELNVTDYKFGNVEASPYADLPFDANCSLIIWPAKELKCGKILGVVGKRREGDYWGFNFHIEALVELAQKTKSYTPLPSSAPVKEDLSLVVPERTPVGGMIDAVQEASDLIYQVELGEDPLDLGKGQKSVWLNLTYQSPDKQLTEKDVKPVREKILQILRDQFSAELRK